MKKIIGIIVFLLAWAGVQADVLTDITSGKFKAKAPEEMTPLADGERYAQLRGNDLFAYSYKTGQVTDTLFEYARAKGNKPAATARRYTVVRFVRTTISTTANVMRSAPCRTRCP